MNSSKRATSGKDVEAVPKIAGSAKGAPDAVKSKYFQRATERARRTVGDPQRLREIANMAGRSAQTTTGPFADVLDDFRALIRLVVAYARGQYRAIPVDALVVVVAGLIYVVSPVDLIPDAIPGIGALDDATVVLWVVKTVRNELDAFRLWESRLTV